MVYCSVCDSELYDVTYDGKRKMAGDLILVMKRYCLDCDEVEHVYRKSGLNDLNQKEDLIIASQGQKGWKQVPRDL